MKDKILNGMRDDSSSFKPATSHTPRLIVGKGHILRDEHFWPDYRSALRCVESTKSVRIPALRNLHNKLAAVVNQQGITFDEAMERLDQIEAELKSL